jgi:D-psicose/D-tagatose/L-ribulose 3-epimerase
MERSIGIHLSYWQTNWADDLHPLIWKAHLAGFDVAEFPLLFPNNLDCMSLRRELDRFGMSASCSTGLAAGTDVTSPDKQVRQAGLYHLRDCLEVAIQLKSPVLVGVTYAAWGVFPQEDRSQRRKQLILSLKESSHMAQDHGIILCMEMINRFEGYLMNTVDQGLAVIQEVDNPNLKLHLDTFHMNIEEDNIGDAIRKARSALGHFHCSENNRNIPGEGHIPWSEVSTAINDVDYAGYIVAETFVNPSGDVGSGLNIWRPLADDLDGSARKAARFLKSV